MKLETKRDLAAKTTLVLKEQCRRVLKGHDFPNKEVNKVLNEIAQQVREHRNNTEVLAAARLKNILENPNTVENEMNQFATLVEKTKEAELTTSEELQAYGIINFKQKLLGRNFTVLKRILKEPEHTTEECLDNF